MDTNKLESIFNKFEVKSEIQSIEELASGHINDTFLVKTSKEPYYILQRINHIIFKDVPGLIGNKVGVSEHLKNKLSHLPEQELMRTVLTFVKCKDGNSYYRDQSGNFWNMMVFIDQSKTFEMVKDEEVAYEGGKLFGEFLNLTSDYDASQLIDVIPRFHDMYFRYGQFEDSMKVATAERIDNAKEYINKIKSLKEEMHILQNLKESGEIKIRVTHNDTKISNALFDMDNKGLCVIDTDTVMPGIIHSDFGDAIRTICNTAAEDESNMELVTFNLPYYKAYIKGFLEKTQSSISEIELKNLPLGAKTMMFMQALRFLTDYLNGDTYYKTKYPEHNFDRARNQFKLMDSFSEQIATA